MPVNAAAENVLGTIGAICWTVQLIPQIWKSWHNKSTRGLSPWLVFLWGISCVPLGVYVIVQNLNIPLILQPQLFGLLSLTSWGQCLYYEGKRTKLFSILTTLCVIITAGGLEAGLVFAVRPSYRRGNEGPVRFFGIFSSALISLSLLPQYYEIYKHKEVIGISILFMFIDLLGGVFSDLSLVFKAKFDVIASITYSLVVFMDGLVIVAAMILNPRARRLRRDRESELEYRASTEVDAPTPTTLTVTRNTTSCDLTKEQNESSCDDPRTLNQRDDRGPRREN